ncbi:hypothetical protein M2138_000704 [Dysgonomonadaceae bacterium PH5-43]|nr:hypothetical protein [Dysgonomonadaceae bacterium PH5-43]
MKVKLLKTMIVGLFALVFVNANAQSEMYVYGSDTSKPLSIDLDKLQTISFTEQSVLFNFQNTETTTLLYKDISLLTFKKLDTGVETPEVNTNVKVYVSGDNAVVESSTEIACVYLYNLHGGLLQQSKEASLSASLPISTLASGMYIIKVICADGRISSHKIIKH